jgi:hypothetical protein
MEKVVHCKRQAQDRPVAPCRQGMEERAGRVLEEEKKAATSRAGLG